MFSNIDLASYGRRLRRRGFITSTPGHPWLIELSCQTLTAAHLNHDKEADDDDGGDERVDRLEVVLRQNRS